MRAIARARAVAMACVAMGMFATTPGRTAAGDAAPTSDNDLQKCIDEHRSLSVLFLVDTSASLGDSDRSGQRVTGLKLAVSSLQSLRAAKETEGLAGGGAAAAFPVYIDFLSFGTGSHRSFPDKRPWTELGTTPEAQKGWFSAIDRFRSDQRWLDTDYVSALNPTGNPSSGSNKKEVGALGMLKAAPRGSCRLLVWFTDGQFDFDPAPNALKQLGWSPGLAIAPYKDHNALTPSVANAVTRGKAVMCGAKGLVDRLRGGSLIDGEGAVTAVVALGTDASKFDLIQSVAENVPSKCGTLGPRGSMYRAQDVNALIFSLQRAVLGAGKGLDGQSIDTCTLRSACTRVDPQVAESYDYPFTLSPGVSSFNLLALEGDADAVEALLVGPNGEQVTIDNLIAPQKMKNHSVVTVTPYSSSPGVYSVSTQLSANPDEWQGQWRVRFVSRSNQKPRASNRASLYVFAGSLSASLREKTVFRRGGLPGKIVVQLLSSAGTSISSPESLPHPELELKVNGTPVDAGVLRPDGTWVIDYPELAKDYPRNSLELAGTLRAMVQIDKSLERYELAKWELPHIGSIEIRALPNYPTIDDPIAPFNEALSQKSTVVHTSVEVVATGDESAGCVSLAGVGQPANSDGTLVGSVRVFADGHELVPGSPCSLELDANKNKQLDIEVSVPKSAVKVDARLKGTLSFTSESKKDSTQRAQFDKPFTASVTPIFDRSVDKRRAAILIAGALLLALLVLYVLNLLSSKLELGTVAVATIPVRFDGRQFLRIDDGVTSPLEVRPADLDGMNVPPEGSHRRVNVGQVEFSSHVSASPFSPVSGRARRSDAHFNVSNRGSTRKGRVGTLDAALKDAWLFSSESYPLVDDTGIKPLDGTLTILVPPDLDEARSHLEHLRPDIEQMVERRCEEHKVEPPTVVPTDPGRDDPGGTPESTRPPSWDWATDDRPPMDVPVTDPFGGTTLGSAPPGPDEKTPRRFGRTRQE